MNQAYSVVIQEEISQRILGITYLSHDSMSLVAVNRDVNFSPKKSVNGGTIGIIPRNICEYCVFKGHLKKNCYRYTLQISKVRDN